MSFRIVLNESDREIEKKINAAIAQEMNIRVRKGRSRAVNKIKAVIPTWIRQQPEVNSLLQEGTPGSLNSQLGLLPNQGPVAVEDIVNSVVESLQVDIRQIDKKTLRGGIEFSIQPSSFRNLLGLASGTVVDGDDVLPWLRWLLVEGSSTIVYGYNYTPDLSGRSGGGTMSAGGVWRIPPQYAGELRDNFITRALINRDRELRAILQEIFNG